MTTRNEYVESLKTRLDEWNADLAKWEAKARTAKTDMRIEYEMQLEALRKQREEAMERLGQLQAAAGEAWKDLSVGADEAWARMRDAFDKARTHFQK
jgi:chromosome segregation ATPase